MIFIWTMASVAIASFTPLLVFVLSYLKKKNIRTILACLLGFAMGTLSGEIIIHLAPNVLAYHRHREYFFKLITVALLLFALMKIVAHYINKKNQPALEHIGFMIFHNLIDGAALATGFLHSTHLGLVTLLILIFHRSWIQIGDIGDILQGHYNPHISLIGYFILSWLMIASAFITLYLRHLELITEPFILATALVFFIYFTYRMFIDIRHMKLQVHERIISACAAILGFMFTCML